MDSIVDQVLLNQLFLPIIGPTPVRLHSFDVENHLSLTRRCHSYLEH